MKRVLLLLMLAVPMLASAQFKYKEVKTNPKYLSGAVSTASDGKVYVERTVNVAGKSVKEVMAEVDLLFGSVVAPAKYVEVSRSDNMRIYRMEDELIFRRSFIATNVATMSARMMVSVSGDVCTICFDNIIYMQGTSSTTTTGMPHEKWKSGWSVADTGVEVITAEESISDKEAVRKAREREYIQTNGFISKAGFFSARSEAVKVVIPEYLTRWSAKYRVKTIDYVEAVAAVLQKRLDK
ncbi:MAG: hypothetical protein IKB37_03960 [Rikenellaceae bacterium]|nr:hypothetical protein [Rikenellaceae bacterium]